MPIATYPGRVVGRNIADGPNQVPDYTGIASCVFTLPALASVGLTQAVAEPEGIEIRTVVNDVHEWLSVCTYVETPAWAKMMIERKTDRILGAHLLGHAREGLIHIFGLAIKRGITASEIPRFRLRLPDFSADIKSML